MLRFSAIAGWALIVSILWFSAGQSLEKQSGSIENRREEFSPIPSELVSPELTIQVKTCTLVSGSGNLRLPARNESFLIINSDDPEASTSPLTISRRPLGGLSAEPWSETATIVSYDSMVDLFSSSLPQGQRREVASDKSEVLSRSKPQPYFIHVTDGPLDDPRQYTTIHSRILEEGQQVRILLDTQEPVSERVRTLARRIRSEFEQFILPRCNSAFGPWRDVDGDGKLTVLLSPWLGKLQGGKTALKGFVRGTDFDERISAPLGNRSDVIYLNSNLSATTDLRSLLGHEYFHVLQCSLRGRQPNRLPLEEDWLSEAQAHLAEQWLNGDDSNLKHRIEAFLDSPGTAPLVVKDYYRAGLWRDDGCRGATFLFLQWCAAREGEDFLKRMLHSSQTGIRGLEIITSQSFSELHRDWALSMLSFALAAEVRSKRSQSIPWSRLEVTPISELGQTLRTSIAPSAIRFFKMSSLDQTTCLRIESESMCSLQFTLVDAEQLAQLNSAHKKARLDKIATGPEKSSDSVR